MTRARPGRTAVLVLGMHRSGTSLIAEILGALGLYLGRPAELIGISPFNERGHFELLPAVEFDNDVLEQAGGTWDRPPAMGRVEALVGKVQPPIDRWFGSAPAWAFKDPRLCLTLPVWLHALSGSEVRVVHVLRDPHAVADSLVLRNADAEPPASHFKKGQMKLADGLGLCTEYNRRATVYVEASGLRRLVVRYDDVLASPVVEVRRLAEFLECSEAGIAGAVGCVQPHLRHHS